jgi:hypothetical protein
MARKVRATSQHPTTEIAIDPSSWNWLLHEHELVANQRLPPSSETLIFKAATIRPDTLTFDEAMSNS